MVSLLREQWAVGTLGLSSTGGPYLRDQPEPTIEGRGSVRVNTPTLWKVLVGKLSNIIYKWLNFSFGVSVSLWQWSVQKIPARLIIWCCQIIEIEYHRITRLQQINPGWLLSNCGMGWVKPQLLVPDWAHKDVLGCGFTLISVAMLCFNNVKSS